MHPIKCAYTGHVLLFLSSEFVWMSQYTWRSTKWCELNWLFNTTTRQHSGSSLQIWFLSIQMPDASHWAICWHRTTFHWVLWSFVQLWYQIMPHLPVTPTPHANGILHASGHLVCWYWDEVMFWDRKFQEGTQTWDTHQPWDLYFELLGCLEIWQESRKIPLPRLRSYFKAAWYTTKCLVSSR